MSRSKTTVLSLEQAEDLAARISVAIDAEDRQGVYSNFHYTVRAADRARVASDLAGLRDCWHRTEHDDWEIPTTAGGRHAARYSEGLLRTALLYWVCPCNGALHEEPCSFEGTMRS